jgi:hypothetical protein
VHPHAGCQMHSQACLLYSGSGAGLWRRATEHALVSQFSADCVAHSRCRRSGREADSQQRTGAFSRVVSLGSVRRSSAARFGSAQSLTSSVHKHSRPVLDITLQSEVACILRVSPAAQADQVSPRYALLLLRLIHLQFLILSSCGIVHC